MSKFLPFDKALAVARSLNLANRFEWEVWCKEGMRPPNVPSNPRATYKDGGWQGWGHWLDTGNTQLGVAKQFLPFEEALAVAQSLNLANRFEWKVWCKEGRRPSNVPSHPDGVYKDGGWQGWGHWLGTGNQASQAMQFLPFGEALAMARSLGLASEFEWREWCKEGMRPPNLPSHPDGTYKDSGWQGWGHWLGTGNTRNTTPFLPFDEALAVASSLGLASVFEWRVWCKEGLRPPNVPAAPDSTYKDGRWQGWVHWLGSGNIVKASKCVPFGEALTFAQSLGLASKKEWMAWCKEGRRPPNVPSNPDATYKDSGWQGWGHWLGTGNTKPGAQEFLPFEEALNVALSLNLANVFDWKEWCKEGMCPPKVPHCPQLAYKGGGWQGWGHWLGTGTLSNQAKHEQFLPFDQALRVARSLRLVSRAEWQAWCRSGARPANMPARPDRAYVHDGWLGWVHWLCHANLGPAPAPAPARTATKRAATAGAAGTAGKSGGKRRRR